MTQLSDCGGHDPRFKSRHSTTSRDWWHSPVTLLQRMVSGLLGLIVGYIFLSLAACNNYIALPQGDCMGVFGPGRPAYARLF